MSTITNALVIGYGNELRGDDGIGARVVRMLQEAALPCVRTLTVQQLTPELGESLAGPQFVIFVDATARGFEVECHPLEPANATEPIGHTGDPRCLLALTRALHGGCPPALLVTVPGCCFEFGEGLSAHARKNAEAAVEFIKSLLHSRASASQISDSIR